MVRLGDSEMWDVDLAIHHCFTCLRLDYLPGAVILPTVTSNNQHVKLFVVTLGYLTTTPSLVKFCSVQ